MRIGANPYKDLQIIGSKSHRVITPVFVPNLEDPYFRNGLEFTRMSLESLIKTMHPDSALTVINNGSCSPITEYLQAVYSEGQIDQLVHHKENMGKIDAVIPIARTASENLITITDSDVLFLNGWMQGVERVFSNFPKAGMVSPVPHGTVYSNYTINTLFDAWIERKLTFEEACDPRDMLRFAESIGKPDTMYAKKSRLKYQMIVKHENARAVVGCGHFVATYRKEVFDHSPKERSELAYATKADRKYLDIPNEKAGLWRLSTVENYAYHMGNQPTEWMKNIFKSLEINESSRVDISNFSGPSLIPFRVKKKIVRILLSRHFRAGWFKSIGLKEFRDEY